MCSAYCGSGSHPDVSCCEAATRTWPSVLTLHAMQGNLLLQRTKAYDPETWKCSLWPVDNPAKTFLAVRSLHKPQTGACTFTGFDE